MNNGSIPVVLYLLLQLSVFPSGRKWITVVFRTRAQTNELNVFLADALPRDPLRVSTLHSTIFIYYLLFYEPLTFLFVVIIVLL